MRRYSVLSDGAATYTPGARGHFETLLHGSPKRRVAALELLLLSESVMNRLIACRVGLSDPDADVRWTSVDGLATHGSAKDAGAIFLLKSDPDWMVRCSVLDALGELDPKRAKGVALSALFEDEVHVVRRCAAILVGEVGRGEAVPTLKRAMGCEQHPGVLLAIKTALINRGQRKYTDDLISAVYSEEPFLPTLAVSLLTYCAERDLLSFRSIGRALDAIDAREDLDRELLEDEIGVLSASQQAHGGPKR